MNSTLPFSGVGSARIAFARTVFARTVQLFLAVIICAPGVTAQSIDAFPSLFAVEGEVTTDEAQESIPGVAARNASPGEATFVGGALDEDVNAGVGLSVSSDAAGRSQGLKLTPDQKKTLRQVLRNERGHDVLPRGNGLGRYRHKIIRLSDDIDDVYGFTLGYGPQTGLTSVENRGRGGWLLAVRDTLEALDDVTYSWVGTLYAEGNLEARIGSALLVYSTESGFSGTIRVRADTWTVASIGGGLHVLINVDETKIESSVPSPLMSGARGADMVPSGSPFVVDPYEFVSDFGTALQAEAPIRKAEQETSNLSQPSGTPISILALWTSAAQNSGIDVNARIVESFSQTNAIYAASGLNNTRVVLAHKQLLPGFNETPVTAGANIGSIVTSDVNRFSSNPLVQSLRDQYNADLVVLFTKPDGYVYITGVANQIPFISAQDPSIGFALVDLKYATSDETFAHEVGHLEGAQHHPDNGFEPGRGAPYGRGYKDEWDNCWWIFSWACGNHKYATTMAYSGNGFGKVGHISNPAIIYQGRQTGIVNSFDNARVISYTNYNVAKYRIAPISVTVTQEGEPNGTYIFSASASGGSSGPLTYEWSVSLGEPGNYQYASSATTYTVQFPSGTSYVRLVVYGGPGEVSYTYRTVTYTAPPVPPAICQIKPFLPECQGFDDFLQRGTVVDIAAETTALITDVSVSPNPMSGKGWLAYSVKEPGVVRISVYDVQGREVAVVVNGETAAGVHSAAVAIGDLAPGVYTLRMVAGSSVVNRRMTVVR